MVCNEFRKRFLLFFLFGKNGKQCPHVSARRIPHARPSRWHRLGMREIGFSQSHATQMCHAGLMVKVHALLLRCYAGLLVSSLSVSFGSIALMPRPSSHRRRQSSRHTGRRVRTKHLSAHIKSIKWKGLYCLPCSLNINSDQVAPGQEYRQARRWIHRMRYQGLVGC
jgi:hypothetical protein